MKLIEGIKFEGRPYEIPDASRDDLPQFFVDMGFKTGAEIGAYRGEFSEKLLKSGLKLFAIDPWKVYKGFIVHRGQRELDLQYEYAKSVLAPYPNCTIVRKTSMEATEDFPDESLDFVYIDANHEFKFVAQDLAEWTKKVRPGGIVSGHDYFLSKTHPGKEARWDVAYVLDAYIQAYNIQNWYLIGSKAINPNEKRDRWRSWMFFKQ